MEWIYIIIMKFIREHYYQGSNIIKWTYFRLYLHTFELVLIHKDLKMFLNVFKKYFSKVDRKSPILPSLLGVYIPICPMFFYLNDDWNFAVPMIVTASAFTKSIQF